MVVLVAVANYGNALLQAADELQADFGQPITLRVVLTPTEITEYETQSGTETKFR